MATTFLYWTVLPTQLPVFPKWYFHNKVWAWAWDLGVLNTKKTALFREIKWENPNTRLTVEAQTFLDLSTQQILLVEKWGKENTVRGPSVEQKTVSQDYLLWLPTLRQVLEFCVPGPTLLPVLSKEQGPN